MHYEEFVEWVLDEGTITKNQAESLWESYPEQNKPQPRTIIERHPIDNGIVGLHENPMNKYHDLHPGFSITHVKDHYEGQHGKVVEITWTEDQ